MDCSSSSGSSGSGSSSSTNATSPAIKQNTHDEMERNATLMKMKTTSHVIKHNVWHINPLYTVSSTTSSTRVEVRQVWVQNPLHTQSSLKDDSQQQSPTSFFKRILGCFRRNHM